MSKSPNNRESMLKRLFDAVGALNHAVAQRTQKVDRIEKDYRT